MNVLSKNSKLLYSGRDEKRKKEEKTAIIEKKLCEQNDNIKI